MELLEFASMSDRDQSNYLTLLDNSVMSTTSGDQSATVNQFYAKKQPGQKISGEGLFELNIAQEVSNELEHPNARRVTIEEVLSKTLRQFGVRLPVDFMPVAKDFVRISPASRELTIESARKALEITRKWVYRDVGPVTPEELKDPTDPFWVGRLNFEEPELISALFTGELSQIRVLRWQALTYMQSFNDTFGKGCPYNSAISSSAEAEADSILQREYIHGTPSGDISRTRVMLKSQKEYRDSAEADAQILLAHVPDKCGGKIITKIVDHMKTYVNSTSR